jgi:hypothetical protein
MKKILLVVSLLLCSAVAGNATVLTFEDRPGDTVTPVQDGYGGFNWDTAATIYSIQKTSSPGSGYGIGTIGNVSVFNGYGVSPTDITLAGPGTFTFNGAQFTSAWFDQTLTFSGYNGATLVDTSSAINISTTSPTWVELDWSGIDRLEITSTDRHWDMDNFTFNGAAPIPEPSTIFLLGAGLAGLGLVRRRAITPE